MAKAPKRAFVCNECGADYPRWQGQCSACHAWNTITEVRLAASPTVARNERLSGYAGSAGVAKVQKLSDISLEELPRFSTGFKEFDRVLGGGVVPGSAILIGGNPGAGKSTLLLQTLCKLAQQMKTLYVTGEESLQQVAMRAHRLGLPTDNLNMLSETSIEQICLIAEEVDIIEVGTILCVGEGVRAVRDLKALYPHKIVLADAKIADAGKILSRMCFEANADWVTVICCADINTAKGALDVAKEFNGDVQIELTGYWTWEQAQQWRDAGIQQVVYHRSRDAQAAGVAWGEADITAIKRLSDMGFKVTVTGGLALEDLPLFKGIPIHVFIAGRSIRDAASPVEAARQFKRSIAELWG